MDENSGTLTSTLCFSVKGKSNLFQYNFYSHSSKLMSLAFQFKPRINGESLFQDLHRQSSRRIITATTFEIPKSIVNKRYIIIK